MTPREAMGTLQRLNSGTATDYALGWHIAVQNGRREVYHSGSQARSSSFPYLQPRQRVAVAVLSNLEQIDFVFLGGEIAIAAAGK